MSAPSFSSTNFKFDGQTNFQKGSVRDIYEIRKKFLIMVVTDRISAFDVVLPISIPYKGQVLAQIAARFLEVTKHIIPNWLIACPDPNVVLGHKCEPYKIEVVVRGYLAGHAWREYKSGKRLLSGAKLPEGLKENDKLPEPIITPATHAEVGHDEDISPEDIIKNGFVPADDWEKIEAFALKLYNFGVSEANKRGLILVDTKYEFGKLGNQLVLMDEVHTPDSSRYFYQEGFADRQKTGESQRQLSKEFVREWLIDHNFQGQAGQSVPDLPTTFIDQITARYIELYEKLLGEKFVPPPKSEDILQRIESNVKVAMKRLN